MTPHPQAEDGSVSLSRKQTVRLVGSWVEEGTPAAVVRIGEGEGRLLAAHPGDDLSVRVAVRKLRRQTGMRFSMEEMFKVKALVMTAFDEADILGLHVSDNFSEEHREWGERIALIYADRVIRGRTPAYLAHCLLNHDLYDALPTLLSDQDRISVITCRDVAPRLQAEHQLAEVVTYQVPSQHAVREVDGRYEAAMHDVPMWPDFYRRLQKYVTVRAKGEVFLIGAGLFGKALCVQVRELGGIALDMGATLDQMAEKVTRGSGRAATGRATHT